MEQFDRAEVLNPDNQDSWGKYKEYRTVDDQLSAEVSCPECGTIINLSGHVIFANGDVSPFVHCHNCAFFDCGRLTSWFKVRQPFIDKQINGQKS